MPIEGLHQAVQNWQNNETNTGQKGLRQTLKSNEIYMPKLQIVQGRHGPKVECVTTIVRNTSFWGKERKGDQLRCVDNLKAVIQMCVKNGEEIPEFLLEQISNYNDRHLNPFKKIGNDLERAAKNINQAHAVLSKANIPSLRDKALKDLRRLYSDKNATDNLKWVSEELKDRLAILANSEKARDKAFGKIAGKIEATFKGTSRLFPREITAPEEILTLEQIKAQELTKRHPLLGKLEPEEETQTKVFSPHRRDDISKKK